MQYALVRFVCVCLCLCVCACVCMCTCACVRACVCATVCVSLHVVTFLWTHWFLTDLYLVWKTLSYTHAYKRFITHFNSSSNCYEIVLHPSSTGESRIVTLSVLLVRFNIGIMTSRTRLVVHEFGHLDRKWMLVCI